MEFNLKKNVILFYVFFEIVYTYIGFCFTKGHLDNILKIKIFRLREIIIHLVCIFQPE